VSDDWQWSREQDGPIGNGPGEEWGYAFGYRLAHFGWRLAAGLIDYGLIFSLPVYFLRFSGLLSYLLPLLFVLANSGFMAAKTTQSLGKRIMGLNTVRIVQAPDGNRYVSYVPVGMGLLRPILHYPEWAIAGIGLLWVLWSRNHNTLIADRMALSLTFRDPRLPQAVYVPRSLALWPK
jgi:uncharacterized RDD family membrane protein YckC